MSINVHVYTQTHTTYLPMHVYMHIKMHLVKNIIYTYMDF